MSAIEMSILALLVLNVFVNLCILGSQKASSVTPTYARGFADGVKIENDIIMNSFKDFMNKKESDDGGEQK